MFSFKSISLAATLAFATFMLASATSGQNSGPDSAARVRELLAEKRDVLASNLTYAEAQFAQGVFHGRDVLDAQLQLLHAEWMLAESAAERVEIRESIVENRRTNESQLAERYLTGDVSFREKTDGAVARIDAEIALVKEVNRRSDGTE
ncbi:hypothetical protein [Allorhodopirellula solitaria]|uniref:Outer membrane efflux protein n=1 Tax=Allorhodopirellula solitaria TaxID=2527987 RepID=A0A5C5YJU2_9BACT|nr:hypothetical protein [Allorhodopirellula solitaria]TWT75163.1 hypothetical protein CA85_04520 [Allorhodopirellula solitaria]